MEDTTPIIDTVSEEFIKKYQNFVPGVYTIQEEEDETNVYTESMDKRADMVTGLLVKNIGSILKHRLDRLEFNRSSARHKYTRQFASYLKCEPSVIETGSATTGTACDDPIVGAQSDLDQLIVITRLSNEEQKKRLVGVPDNPAHVWVDMTESFSADTISRMDEITVLKDGKRYLSPVKVLSKFKSGIGQIVGKGQIPFDKENCFTKTVKPAVTFAHYSDTILFPKEEWQSYYTATGHLPKDGKDQIKQASKIDVDIPLSVFEKNIKTYLQPVHIDHVPALACRGWPNVAYTWLKWAIKKYGLDYCIELGKVGFHVVPKTSPGGSPDLDWRISFSLVEGKLVETWTDVQKDCFVIVKSVLKRNPTLPNSVPSSYHVLTLMFWAIHKTSCHHWGYDNLGTCVLGIIDQLIHSLTTHKLPHYFISEVNLFDGVSSDILDEAAFKLCSIRHAPLDFVPKLRKQEQYVQQHELMLPFITSCINRDMYLNQNELQKLNMDLSRTCINIAILSLLDYELGRLTLADLKKREALLHVYIALAQAILDETTKSISRILCTSDGSALESHVAIIQNRTRAVAQNFPSDTEMLQHQFLEVQMKRRISELQMGLFMQLEVQKFRENENSNSEGYFQVCMRRFCNGSDFLGISTDDIMKKSKTEWLSLEELAKLRKPIFHT